MWFGHIYVYKNQKGLKYQRNNSPQNENIVIIYMHLKQPQLLFYQVYICFDNVEYVLCFFLIQLFLIVCTVFHLYFYKYIVTLVRKV